MEYFGVRVKVAGKGGTRTYYFLSRSDGIHDAVGKSINSLEFDSREVFKIDIQVIKIRDFLAVKTVKQWT